MQYCVSCAICKDMKHKFKGTFTKSKTRSYTTITTMHLVSFYALIMLAIIYTLSTMCDAVTEHDLVSALQVSVYPEIIFFTKAGKILYLRKQYSVEMTISDGFLLLWSSQTTLFE